MICLNSVMLLMFRTMATFLHVCTSTPVVSILGSRHNHWRCGLDLFETAKVTLTDIPFIRNHPAHVVRVLLHHFWVAAAQCRSHIFGVLLIHTEHDSFCERIVFDEVREMLGNGLSSPFQDDILLKVRRHVQLIRDGPVEAVS